jgi:uncharacterized protein YggE
MFHEREYPMKKTFIPLAVIAALSVLPVMVQAEDNSVSATGTRLDINAQATVKVKPDIATVSAGVVTKAATPQEARELNAQKMQSVFTALKAKKINEADMQTSGLTINPDYVYEQNQAPKITGYQANNSLTIRLKDMDKIGDVIDALIKNGINQFNGPAFSLDNPETATDQARRNALEKARKRAELYASATGLKIKRIVAISENTNMGMPVPMMMMAKASAGREMADTSTPIATGQVDVDVTVNVTYELGQ